MFEPRESTIDPGMEGERLHLPTGNKRQGPSTPTPVSRILAAGFNPD